MHMPIIGTSVFTDPDDYCGSYRGAKINLIFTGHGIFRARLAWIELTNLHLLSVQESLPRIASLAMAPKRSFLTFPTHFDPSPVWNGMPFLGGDILVNSRGERMYQRTHGQTRWASISVKPEFLADYGQVLAGLDFSKPSAIRAFHVPSPAATELRRLHSRVCRLATTKPDIIAHPEVARALEDELLRALLNCLAFESTSGGGAMERHADVINRFDLLLETDFDRQPTIKGISAAIGVSERTLITHCKRFFGMGPLDYMQLRGLNLARASFRRNDPAPINVADTSWRYGFSDARLFTIKYQRIFGETPTATLQRSRVETPVPDFALRRNGQ
jgi:AraC-like DNA-binding protein